MRYTKDGCTKEWKQIPKERKENLPNFLKKAPFGHSQILGWPIRSFRCFCKMLCKNPNELFGQPNICWWTGKPGMLQSMGSQRAGRNWATELNWIYAGLSWIQMRTGYVSSHTKRKCFKREQFGTQAVQWALKPVTYFEMQLHPLIGAQSSGCSLTSLQLSGRLEMKYLQFCGYSKKMHWKELSRIPALSSCSKNLPVFVTASRDMREFWGAGLWMQTWTPSLTRSRTSHTSYTVWTSSILRSLIH